MIKHLILLFSLGCFIGCSNNGKKPKSNENENVMMLTNSELEFSYISNPDETTKIKTSNKLIDFNGEKFNAVIIDEHDPYNRGILIKLQEEDSGKVSWLIEGNPENSPGVYGVETNIISSKISSKEGQYYILSTKHSGEFARLRIVTDTK